MDSPPSRLQGGRMRDDRASDTATLVARSILLAAEDGRLRSLLAEGEAELLGRILGVGGGWFGLARRWAWARGVFLGSMDRMVPGIVAHYLARKRRIEIAVREALAAGAARVVVIGAGFDTLAWRLRGEFPGVDFWELDHPATQEVKRRALGEAANFSYRPLDLTARSPAGASDLVVGPCSVFVVEGLTMYLPEERVVALLRDCAALAGRTGRVIFTYMEEDEAGSIGFRGQHPLVAAWLERRSEPFLWGVGRERLAGFLERCGLGAAERVDEIRLRREVLVGRGCGEIRLARGECICLCSPLSR